MANKFGLLFSDIKSNRKLLMIDDTSYTGAVKPLIGNKEPIEISYDANDDIHDSPIMGSRMEMNFWDTETRTNMIPYSTQFDQWDENLFITTNQLDPPFKHINGRNLISGGASEEVDLLQYAGGASGARLNVTLTPQQQYCFSCYIKQFGTNTLLDIAILTDETGDIRTAFNFSNNTLTSSSNVDKAGYKFIGNGWYRIYVVGTMDNTVNNAKVRVNNNFTAGYYWGAQLEEGSIPTEFIYTDDASVNTEYDTFFEQNDRQYLAKLYFENSGSFTEYWRGFITKDIYKEVLIPKPYPMKLVATDGLGELSGAKFEPNEITYEDIGVNYDSIAVTLANALKKTGHNFEIHALLDLRYKDGLSLKHVFEQDHVNVAKKNWGIWTPKELIQEYLRGMNAKIFQSFGKWYIISNSAYYDTRVQDASYTTSNAGGTVTGIKSDLSDYLVNNGNEHLKFQRFNANGTIQSTTTETNLLVKIPTDLQPLRKDFSRDYLPAIKTSEYLVDNESRNSSTKFTTVNSISQIGKFLNTNGSFEATNNGTISLYNWTEITQDDVSYQGNNVWLSSGTNAYVTSLLSTQYVTQYIESTSNNQSPADTTTEFSVKLKPVTSQSQCQMRWQLKRSDSSGFFTTQYWNDVNKTFTTTVTNNQKNLVIDEWNTVKVTIPTTTINQSTDIFTFTLYKPALPANDTNFKLYMDHVQFMVVGDLVQGDSFLRTQANQVDKYQLESKVFINYGQRSREFQSTVEKNNHLGKAVSQMILNDRREFTAIYEGTFYNNNATPISPLNKVWIDFGSSVLREDISAIIQKMTYKVKSNEVKMRFYKPNPDDDVTNDFKLRKNID